MRRWICTGTVYFEVGIRVGKRRTPSSGGVACREDPADFARFAYQDDIEGFSVGVDVFKLSDWFMVL